MKYNAVYGAGFFGSLFCQELEDDNIKIDYFIDDYTKKDNLLNKPIKRLNEVDIKNTNVYIAISDPNVEVLTIKTLNELGCTSIQSFFYVIKAYSKLIQKFLSQMGMWFTGNVNEMVDNDEINKFKKLLKDEKSLELLERIVNFRNTLDLKYYLTPDLEPQYFPSDIDLFSTLDKIRFVDGGSFIGDTINPLIIESEKRNKKIDYIACFEPDSQNILRLSEEIQKQKSKFTDTNFLIYPCGLWSENKILTFSNTGSATSSIVSDSGDDTIQIMTASLDKLLIGAKPNFIKMDIEGAEKQAIIGMKDIIAKYSPVLAISLYHKPSDLWELPLLIHKINENYNMYIRIYGNLGTELVLYCVPK